MLKIPQNVLKADEHRQELQNYMKVHMYVGRKGEKLHFMFLPSEVALSTQIKQFGRGILYTVARKHATF